LTLLLGFPAAIIIHGLANGWVVYAAGVAAMQASACKEGAAPA